MTRTARASAGDFCYHVLNRGNAGGDVFLGRDDYEEFLGLIGEAAVRRPIRLLAYCLLPGEFRLVVWTYADGDLSRWMHWLMTTQVRRYLRRHEASGHLWEGRFRAFPVQPDGHLLDIIRHVESAPVRAGVAARAGDWPWSSFRRLHDLPRIVPGPVARPAGWAELVDFPMGQDTLERIGRSLVRSAPYGDDRWTWATADRLGLVSSLRPRGRPRDP